jgi:NitT/TauT family transport system substrate-binding protein
MPCRKSLLKLIMPFAICMMGVLILLTGETGAAQSARTMSLKIALMPIPDVLPFHVAKELGFFEEAGLKVEAFQVASPVDRDNLMQAGQIDGMLTELTTTAYFNRDRPTIKIVAVARRPMGGHALFRILSAPGSNLKKPADLAGVPIGVSMHTVIEYVTGRLLTSYGVGPEDLNMKSVPVIPERFQLLMQGQLKAATLPEPLASSALAAGANLVISDAVRPEYSISVLGFSTDALSTRASEVRLFLKAWDRAAARLNADPQSFLPLMRKKIRLPANIQNTFSIPEFPRREVPTADQWKDVMEWMITQKLLKRPLPYEDAVTRDFLPQP